MLKRIYFRITALHKSGLQGLQYQIAGGEKKITITTTTKIQKTNHQKRKTQTPKAQTHTHKKASNKKNHKKNPKIKPLHFLSKGISLWDTELALSQSLCKLHYRSYWKDSLELFLYLKTWNKGKQTNQPTNPTNQKTPPRKKRHRKENLTFHQVNIMKRTLSNLWNTNLLCT